MQKCLYKNGVPAALRLQYWKEVCGVAAYKRTHGVGYYQSLLQKVYPKEDDIWKDVIRTMTHRRPFNTQAGYNFPLLVIPPCLVLTLFRQQQLGNVLKALAVHFPKVGYCQGMNNIAGMFLLKNSEEDSFWFIVHIFEKLEMQNFYTDSMPLLLPTLNLLSNMILLFYPQLHRHLVRKRLNPRKDFC